MSSSFSNKAITFAAIFVSICALFVSIYQTRILSQQKDASVWPYLRFGHSYGQDYFYMTVENSGVGPAIIDDMKYIYNDSIFHQIDGLADFIIQELEQDSITVDKGYSYSNIESSGTALKAGENRKIFSIETKNKRFIDSLLSKSYQASIRIKYCSIYKTCWLNVNNDIEEN